MYRLTIVVCLTVLVIGASLSLAGIPKLINYQGMLTDEGDNPLNETVNLTFKIYTDSLSGSDIDKKWEETQTGVEVVNGLFNVVLGKVSSLNLDFSQDYWLDITVGAEHLPDRIRFTSVGYTYRASIADSALAIASESSSKWHVSSSVLYTNGYWGIARGGGTGNVLHGDSAHTMINLGIASTAGKSGQNNVGCTVGGGASNTSSGIVATVSGGAFNSATDTSATVSGGDNNSASRYGATVGGGTRSAASGQHATVGGGGGNTASGRHSTVGGGEDNTASGENATVIGGWRNVAGGDCAVSGGCSDTVAGDFSFAAGSLVRLSDDADHTFAFGYDFTTSTPHAVVFYDAGSDMKVGIQTTDPSNILTIKQYSATYPVADAWPAYSSRRWKQNIRPIERALDKVTRLRGVYFNWKETKRQDIGMIAEEVGEVVPEVVSYEKNGVDAQALDYSRLAALLVEAIKEQQGEIETLKAKLEKLESGR